MAVNIFEYLKLVLKWKCDILVPDVSKTFGIKKKKTKTKYYLEFTSHFFFK